MATVTIHPEPVGIVVRDGATTHNEPRIAMWFWADESGVPERELE